jgi:hypothetical protein
MLKKRGVEIQFNWIFVLIIGAVIIIFFTTIVLRQKSASEASTRSTILTSLETIISGTGISTDTVNLLTIPKSSIEFGCNRISIEKTSRQFTNLILFAPGMITDNRLITHTVPFNLPFKSTNLLFITSPRSRYILIGDGDTINEINRSLPSEMEKEFYDILPPNLKSKSSLGIRFVVVGEMIGFPESFAGTDDEVVTAVRITGNDESGILDFYRKNGDSWVLDGTSAYITKSSLLGSIYSGTKENYECNMENVFARHNLVTQVYTGRTLNLRTNPEVNDFCRQTIYTQTLTSLNILESQTHDFKSADFVAIADAAESLEDQYNEAQLYSCPSIY